MDPLGIYSVAMYRLGGLVVTAIRRTIFGCLSLANIFISFSISFINSVVILGLNIFLRATCNNVFFLGVL